MIEPPAIREFIELAKRARSHYYRHKTSEGIDIDDLCDAIIILSERYRQVAAVAARLELDAVLATPEGIQVFDDHAITDVNFDSDDHEPA